MKEKRISESNCRKSMTTSQVVEKCLIIAQVQAYSPPDNIKALPDSLKSRDIFSGMEFSHETR